LSAVWSALAGQWTLSGQTPARARVPGFSLHGADGAAAAGAWFWSRYRAEVSVRPLTATAVGLRVGCWDDGNRVELRGGVGQGRLALVQVADGAEQVLAAADRALPARQWTRLALSLADGRAVAWVDGAEVLAARTDAVAGGVALATAGGAAVFDDVRVCSVDETPAWPRVHPPEYDKGPGGLLDRDTWASAAAAWEPTRTPRLVWHVGRFAGDLHLSLPWRPTGLAPALTVHLGAARGVPAPVLTVSGAHTRVELQRQRGVLSASVDGRSVALAAAPGDGSLCLGLEWCDLALAPSEVELTAEHVREYLFDKAPADWREGGGEWSVVSRWTCNPQWSWLCGADRQGPAVFWYKWPLAGDLVVQAPVGPLMHGSYGPGCEDFARTRLTLCADGRDPWSGYCLELGQPGRDVCTLYRQHQPVASSADRLPRWREIHNAWFDLRLERRGAELTATFHGRPLLRWTDPQPLPDGHLCLWTEANGILTPYLAIYGAVAAAPRR
jgi:hypothetical protein